MKGNKTAICLLLLGVLLGFTATAPAEAITIIFDPVSQNVALGNPAGVDLIISGLGDLSAPSLSAYDLDISFVPTILSFNNVVYGNQLDIFGLGFPIQWTTSGSGTINLTELSLNTPSDLDTYQLGSFTLATLYFDTIGFGNSPLNVSINALGDALGDPLTANVDSGWINVTDGSQSVPEPSSLILIASGVFALGWQRFLRKLITKSNV
jgi:hypothetical protein